MDSTIAVSTPPTGGTPPAEGEKHANMPLRAGKPARGRSPNKTTPGRASGQTGGVDSTVAEPLEIVRSTSRLTLDITKSTVPEESERKRIFQSLHRVRRTCALVRNELIRQLWRADEDALAAWRATGAKKMRAKDWPFPQINLYKEARAIAPDLASGIAATLSHEVKNKWSVVRFDALVRNECNPPRYRNTAAFPIRAQSFRVKNMGDSNYELSFSLRPGRHPGGMEFSIPIHAWDWKQNEGLLAISSGRWRMGSLLLEQDRRRKSRWYVRISYTRLAALTSSVKTGALHRGISTFLTAVTEAGDQWLYDGHDIEAYLKQMVSRRQAYQRSLKASNRAGHGRSRALAPIATLAGRADRWRDTKCQVVASRVVKWLSDKGVGRVIIEDLSGIRDGDPQELIGGKAVWDRIQTWPYYNLERRILSCCEDVGISVIKVPAHHISQTCPKCAFVEDENAKRIEQRFRCGKCGHRRHIDVVAALAVLARGVAMEEDGASDSSEIDRLRIGGKRGARKPPRKAAGRKEKRAKGRKR